jgi:hypothetical protein
MEENRKAILDLLVNKAAVKQDIADYSETVLASFLRIMEEEVELFRTKIEDDRVRLKVDKKGDHEFVLYIGSDVLVFQLHRNVFRLPDEHSLWNSDYMKESDCNGYFGIINIYNFLAESFEQNRLNDAGYLVGRIFMNRNKHFMIEGKGQLGFLFNDLVNNTIDDEMIRNIIHTSISYCIEFDLVTPPYDLIQEISVMEIKAMSSQLQMATGKRLGFKFSSENNDVY